MIPRQCARPLLRRAHRAVSLIFSFLVLSGCAVGPRYSRPSAPVPPAYKEEPPGWKMAQPGDQITRGKWWEIFGDAQLNTLEDQVSVGNQNLKAAFAQFEQARALVRLNRADYYPTVTAGVSVSRNRLSSNRGVATSLSKNSYSDITVPVNVSYEPDLFGRIRRTVEASRAGAQASAGDLESLRLTLQSELAVDYFQLRTLDAEEQLLNDTVAAFEKALELTQNRYKGGVASAVDVAQAQTQLETTRAQAIDVHLQRSQFEHAIATLIGQPASTFSIPVAPWTLPPPVTPAGLPSDLLERRPDIAAAERRVAAANAEIGVARAAYFPLLTLSGSGGYESSKINNLFTGPSGFVSAGASAVVTAFDVGRRRAVSEQARAAYDQTVANYRETVLTAFQEVEDNLAALRILENEARTQDAAVAAAQNSLNLSTNRYKGGVVSYLEVITAQSIALTDERAAVDILRRRMTASVQLIKALGGGWNAANLPTVKLNSASPQVSGQ
ncbi:MAG TPA: efflux transporter outer membrane subunit [Terriglobales bacterium]|nr:efflux transporter outer membrane subunit [Terriglobales bacterium]